MLLCILCFSRLLQVRVTGDGVLIQPPPPPWENNSSPELICSATMSQTRIDAVSAAARAATAAATAPTAATTAASSPKAFATATPTKGLGQRSMREAG